MHSILRARGELAEHFGGGGHPQSAGFKLYGRNFEEVKDEVKQTMRSLQSHHGEVE